MPPSLDSITKWRNDPVSFVKDVFSDPDTGAPIEMAPWHEEAMRLVQNNDRVSIRAARGVGKTALLTWVSYHRLCCFTPARNIFTAPRRDQMNMAAWSEMRKWLRAMDSSLRSEFDVQSNRVKMRGVDGNESIATTVTTGEYEGMQGIHDSHLTFIADEANGVPDNVFDVVLGSMTTKNSKVLLTGNPRASAGLFFRTHTSRKLSDRWRTMRVSAHDVRHMSYFDPEWIEEMRATWGENSWQWSTYVLGEFPQEDSLSVIPAAFILDAAQRDVSLKPGYFPIWGFDPAFGGGDRCALVKRHGNIVESVDWWRSQDTTLSKDRIVTEFYAAKNKPAAIVVDSSVGGLVIAQDLQRLGLPIVGIGASERALTSEIYANMRAEMWFRGRAWFESRDCKIPDNDDLTEELAATNKRLTSSNNLSTQMKQLVEQKDDVRQRIGRSTDLADAFLLTLMCPSRERDPSYLKKELDALRKKSGYGIQEYTRGTTWQSQIHIH